MEPYEYKRVQDGLEIAILQQYGINQSEYLHLDIEAWYKYQEGYFAAIERAIKNNSWKVLLIEKELLSL